MLMLLSFSFACNRAANKAAVAAAEAPKQRPVVVKKSANVEEMAVLEPQDAGPVEAIVNIGGSNPAALRTPEGRAAAKENPQVVAELRKTPCYGDCPVFTLQIMTDGSLRFDGKRNTDLLGKYEGTVSGSDPFVKIGLLAVKNRFFNFADFYPEDPAMAPKDLPRTVTTIDWRGRKKTVTHLVDGPAELLEIEKYLQDLILDAIWTPLEEPKE